MDILVIDGDHLTAQTIKLILGSEGYRVTTAGSGAEGIELARAYVYRVVLLELDLPDISGYEVLQALNSLEKRPAVFIVSVRGDEHEKISGLDKGADDYLAKPFSREELVVRIRTILRRYPDHTDPLIKIGDLVVDRAAWQCTMAGKKLRLTKKQFQLVEILAMSAGRPVNTKRIFRHLYAEGPYPTLSVLRVLVYKLRKALAGSDVTGIFIDSVQNKGYLLRWQTDTGTATDH